MRISEWIQAGFTTIIAVAAWIRPLTTRRRSAITLLAGFTIFAVIFAHFSVRVLAPLQASIFRDWLPVVFDACTLLADWSVFHGAERENPGAARGN